MNNTRISLSIIAALFTVGMVARQLFTEAPSGFPTPTLGQMIGPNGELIGGPAVQSVSNGIEEPTGDTFTLDQAQFE